MGWGWGVFYPQGTFSNIGRHFWLSHLGGARSPLYLVGRGQRSCPMSFNAQDSPPTKMGAHMSAVLGVRTSGLENL